MAKVIIKVSKAKINTLDKLIDSSDVESISIDERLELANKINNLLSRILDEISSQMVNFEDNNFKFDKELNYIMNKAYKTQSKIFSNIESMDLVGMNNHE